MRLFYASVPTAAALRKRKKRSKKRRIVIQRAKIARKMLNLKIKNKKRKKKSECNSTITLNNLFKIKFIKCKS